MGGSNAVTEHVRRYVEECIGHTVKEKPNQGEPESLKREDEISNRPGAHADNHQPFKAESGDTKRKDRHEDKLRELVECRQGNRCRIAEFAQVGNHGREEVVTPENTDHK